ncbi:beta-1,3-galactosyltransferase 2 [Danio aesculapii]|uniref:beta-1,3-galactosyltransferase 2 n=1 Tax=Danio aesculapii TaxID=1142201 RepID=UPI0024BFDA13|nr:beta-1,3-galactosyltransferase 2 [Danio aesculapii]
MEWRLFRNGWKRCSLAQDRVPNRCHIKTGFLLLLALTFLLSIIVYISDSSFKSAAAPDTLYETVVNQIRSYYVTESTSSIDNQTMFSAPTQTANQQGATQNISEHHHMAHPLNYYFTLDQPDICKQKNPFLVLMVPVAPYEVKARSAIRSTWGNETTVQGKAVLTLFLVGLIEGADSEKVQKQLEEESRQHRDLIQSNFVDSYFNLTIKTMVIMDWLATRCPQANYSMKIDSDMFLNVNNLVTLLSAPNTPRENYITGVLMRNRFVVRNKNSKWYVSKELYPEPKYPTYLLGMGYVFSNDLPSKIVEASKYVKPFNIEDAYIGACLKQLAVEPSSPPEPSQFRIYMGQYKRENFLRAITTILGSPQQLIDIWKDVNKPM